MVLIHESVISLRMLPRRIGPFWDIIIFDESDVKKRRVGPTCLFPRSPTSGIYISTYLPQTSKRSRTCLFPRVQLHLFPSTRPTRVLPTDLALVLPSCDGRSRKFTTIGNRSNAAIVRPTATGVRIGSAETLRFPEVTRRCMRGHTLTGSSRHLPAAPCSLPARSSPFRAPFPVP